MKGINGFCPISSVVECTSFWQKVLQIGLRQLLARLGLSPEIPFVESRLILNAAYVH